MIDWRGNEYDVGDIIAYPRMSGRSCEVVEAEVLEIGEERTHQYSGEKTRTVWVRPMRSSRFRFGLDQERPEWLTWRKDRVAIKVSDNITVLGKI